MSVGGTNPPQPFPSEEERAFLEVELVHALRRDADELLELRARADRAAEDGVYRLLHQSFKVYRLQTHTTEIVAALQRLLPGTTLNPWFTQIVTEGTEKTFAREHNTRWLQETRPIVEAFLVAKQALDMTCKYARAFEEPPRVFEPGWGTVLYLFMLR